MKNIFLICLILFSSSCSFNTVKLDDVVVERESYFTLTSFSDFSITVEDKIKHTKKEITISGVVSDQVQALKEAIKGAVEGAIEGMK